MKLEIIDEQAYVLIEALDLFSRVLIGQPEEVGQIMLKYNVNMLTRDGGHNAPDKRAYEEHHKFTDSIRELKHSILGIHFNGSYGIHNTHVHDNSRVAYDMLQVLRNHLAWKNHKSDSIMGTMGVSFDRPMRTSKLPLPVIDV